MRCGFLRVFTLCEKNQSYKQKNLIYGDNVEKCVVYVEEKSNKTLKNRKTKERVKKHGEIVKKEIVEKIKLPVYF